MTETVTPRHVHRTKQAEQLGYNAGWEHYLTAVETCPPDQWDNLARACWVQFLADYRINPFEAAPFPDATDDQNQHYARQWELAFVKGTNAARAAHGRRTAA